MLAATGHSRAPVVRHGGLDDAVGVVHLRDLVGVPDDRPVDEIARPPMLLPDSLPVVDALRQFKAERQHIALVVDERGAVDGIVTLEDLLEEIVGEIYDETDRDVRSVRREPDGALLLPGTFPVHDLPDIGVELPGRARPATTPPSPGWCWPGSVTSPPSPGRSVTRGRLGAGGGRHRPPGDHRGAAQPRTRETDADADQAAEAGAGRGPQLSCPANAGAQAGERFCSRT